MALTHLVDTSVLTRIGSSDVRAALEPMVRNGSVARAGISDLEIGYAARSATEWDALSASLALFALVDTTSDHVKRAGQVQRLLAERHQRGRNIPDLLVAAAAEAFGLTVLHYDADFDRIARATGQATKWVVPRGSVD